jgi:hypothetical protein
VQREGGVRGRVDGEIKRDWSFSNAIGERRSFEQLHHEVVGANIVESADVWVIECRDGVHFAREAF